MSAVKDPIVVTEDVMTILDWPTDVVSIDYDDGGRPPHTYLIFIPGNPGLVGWYIPALTLILRNIGPGFAIRGISHAGHGITDETVQVEDWHNNSTAGGRNNSNNDGATTTATPRNVQIPWTVNGQILHKMAWMESMPELQLLQSPPQLQPRRIIFLSHSIGAHMVQRLLVLRRDWRSRTLAIVHWMPFLRMEAPTTTQFQLDTVAHHPDYVIGIGKQLVQMTPRWVKEYVLQKHVPDQKGRVLAVNLVEHPTFVRNFLELGTEEVRDLPQLPDVSAFVNSVSV